MNKIRTQNIFWFLTGCLTLLFITKSTSQISVSNLLQYQVGNLPGASPSDRTSLYNQLNINYLYENIRIGGRIEYFNVDNRDQQYSNFQQKFIQYQNENFEIRLGNFYEILGKGLLLRTYEIPGVIYEETGSRQRYGFYKDIEGILLRYATDHLYVKLLYGNPLDLLQPPARTRNQRRPSIVQGGEINFNFSPFIAPGFLYLRSEQNNTVNEFAGINFNGNLPIGMQYYLEYVQDTKAQDQYFAFGSTGRHAFYGFLNQSFNWASFSIELKDYHDFTLNFNDPPSLVREQPRTLLNRGTHAIQTQDERGYQLEGIFNIGSLNTITANHSRAENKFADSKFIFQEYYIDLNYYITDRTLGKAFIDWAEDEVINALERWTIGILVEQELIKYWSLITDLQTQQFKRAYELSPRFNHTVKNHLLDLTITKSPNLAFGINVEAAQDPLESNTLNAIDMTNYKYWMGFNFNYLYSQNHSINLFYGERRGGTACSGGICYEVQPFKGFELRLNSIF